MQNFLIINVNFASWKNEKVNKLEENLRIIKFPDQSSNFHDFSLMKVTLLINNEKETSSAGRYSEYIPENPHKTRLLN